VRNNPDEHKHSWRIPDTNFASGDERTAISQKSYKSEVPGETGAPEENPWIVRSSINVTLY
jgi:hypothetical protein